MIKTHSVNVLTKKFKRIKLHIKKNEFIEWKNMNKDSNLELYWEICKHNMIITTVNFCKNKIFSFQFKNEGLYKIKIKGTNIFQVVFVTEYEDNIFNDKSTKASISLNEFKKNKFNKNTKNEFFNPFYIKHSNLLEKDTNLDFKGFLVQYLNNTNIYD